MEVTFIPSHEINSDLGVVNAARVSLGKKSEWKDEGEFCTFKLKESDKKLISYLSKNNHWTPFAHGRCYFEIHWRSLLEELTFYRMSNLAGFSIRNKVKHGKGSTDYVKGSLYGWLFNLSSFPVPKEDVIYQELLSKFPVSVETLLGRGDEPFHYCTGVLPLSEEWIVSQGLWDVSCATLRVKVPIFIARQIRTSQVGFSYSDAYVESESFSFNEVSRRYVNDDPEFYEIQQWRVREGKHIKQGSTGILEGEYDIDESNSYQRMMIRDGISSYQYFNAMSIAPEQLRSLLPQSMYTEFYMTGTLHRWAQFIELRSKGDVQLETRIVTHMIRSTLKDKFPEWAFSYNL